MHELNALPTHGPRSAHIYNGYENERTTDRPDDTVTILINKFVFLFIEFYNRTAHFRIPFFGSISESILWITSPIHFLSVFEGTFFFCVENSKRYTCCNRFHVWTTRWIWNTPQPKFSSVPFLTQLQNGMRITSTNTIEYIKYPGLKGSIIFIFFRKIFVFTLIYCDLMAVVVVIQSIVSVFCVTQ